MRGRDTVTGLVVLWNADEPNTLGAFLPLALSATQTYVLGRGVSQFETADGGRAALIRQRVTGNEPLPPFESPSLSRTQVLIRVDSQDRLELTNVGRRRLFVNGVATESQCVGPGDVIELGAQLTLMCVKRPREFESYAGASTHEFGNPDAHGFVGESPAAWKLRREIASAARRQTNVLIIGNYGTGKELAATAIHALSGCAGQLVARRVAKIPEASRVAELFGNEKGCPTPTEPEREGLFGTARDGTLYLDGFALLPRSTQASVLRVFEAGTYQRLGNHTQHHSTFRLIAGIDDSGPALQAAIAEHFELQLHTPRLDQRPEDIPLLARHLLCSIRRAHPGLSQLFAANGLPRFDMGFIRKLVHRSWEANVRELRNLLWLAVSNTQGDCLQWPDQPVPTPSGFAPPRDG